MLSLLFAIIIRLHPAAPYVVENEKMGGGEVHMIIQNPLSRPVVVTIHCGGAIEYDETKVKIPARERMEIAVEAEPPADFCSMTDWH